MSSLANKVKSGGYRMTRQRQAVLDAVMQARGCHLSCDEVYDLLKKSGNSIGLATVYRTLSLLEQMGFLQKVFIKDGFKYEAVDQRLGEKHSHHHLICKKCGSVTEIHEDFLEELETKIETETGFIIADHTLQFSGLCSRCVSLED